MEQTEFETYTMFLPNGIEVEVTTNKPSDEALLNFLKIGEQILNKYGKVKGRE